MIKMAEKFKSASWKEKKHTRAFSLERADGAAIDEEARTVEVAFSSEESYQRYFGHEILDHGSESVRLGRLQEGGAVLLDHDHGSLVGVIESVELSVDRVGRALLRFGKSAKADEAFRDVVDGIRRWISVGYSVLDMERSGTADDGEPIYRVTDWEPFEISFVSVPADSSVGVGRSVESEIKSYLENQTMPDVIETPAAAVAPAPVVDNTAAINSARTNGATAERTRMSEIAQISEEFDVAELGREHQSAGTSVHDFRQHVLSAISARTGVVDVPAIGLTPKEVKSYSFARAIAALANPENAALREAAAFEFEVSRTAEAETGRRSMGIMVPADAMGLARSMSAGSDEDGGYTVETELRGLIELLVNQSQLVQAGASVLTGLEGNVAFPRQISGTQGYWLAEGGAPTESSAKFDQVALTPRTVGAFTEYTRQLLLQSSIDVESFVRMDLARTVALALDLAGFYGDGSGNTPVGVANQTGVNAGTIAGAYPTYAEYVAFETAVASSNAEIDGSASYLMRPTMRGNAKTTEKFSGTNGMPIWEPGNTVNGYGVGVSNQIVDKDLFFGYWSQVMVGMWGGMDLMVNPYALDTSGGVRVTALQSADIAVRHPESFVFGQGTEVPA